MAISTLARQAPRRVEQTHEPTRAQLAVAGRVGSRDGAINLGFLNRPFTVIDGGSETTAPVRPALSLVGSRMTVTERAANELQGMVPCSPAEGMDLLKARGYRLRRTDPELRRALALAGISTVRVGQYRYEWRAV